MNINLIKAITIPNDRIKAILNILEEIRFNIKIIFQKQNLQKKDTEQITDKNESNDTDIKTFIPEYLYNIDISQMIELGFSTSEWEYMKFKKWVVQKDKNWHKYIKINDQKVTEHYKWINWLSYETNPYYPLHDTTLLRIWFCVDWKFTHYVNITALWTPEKSKLINSELENKLWTNLYLLTSYNESEINDFIYNISPQQVYKEYYNNYRFRKIHEYTKDNTQKNEDKPWFTWIWFIEFKKQNEYNTKIPWILIAEFKDWKIVWPCRCFRFSDTIQTEYLMPNYK